MTKFDPTLNEWVALAMSNKTAEARVEPRGGMFVVHFGDYFTPGYCNVTVADEERANAIAEVHNARRTYA